MSLADLKARHSSETPEHFTPLHIVEAARTTLGAIDLDPFSCATADERVRAARFFDGKREGDGWVQSWHGRVFCNPPGGRGANNESNQKRAWFRLAAEHHACRVTAAIFVCFSVELLQTTQVKSTGKIPLDFPICYCARRVAYVKPDGTVGASPPHSSCIIFVPPHGLHGDRRPAIERFRTAFADIGRVVVPEQAGGAENTAHAMLAAERDHEGRDHG